MATTPRVVPEMLRLHHRANVEKYFSRKAFGMSVLTSETNWMNNPGAALLYAFGYVIAFLSLRKISIPKHTSYMATAVKRRLGADDFFESVQ